MRPRLDKKLNEIKCYGIKLEKINQEKDKKIEIKKIRIKLDTKIK
jgi:hypothetical protein